MSTSSPTHVQLGSLIELPDSPSYNFSQQGVTQVRKYGGLFSLCLASAFNYGTKGSGAQAGYYVENSKVSRSRGEQGKLEVTWRSGSLDGSTDPGLPLPPDEVGVSIDNQSPRIESHPKFIPLSTIPGELANVEDACRSQNNLVRDAAYAKLSELGKKLVNKIRGGLGVYYLASLRYSWATHSWSPPIVTRGGFSEAPLGPLAGFFVGDFDWLREGDNLQFSNGVWRVTRNWIAGPNGHWDPDIYAPT